MRQTTPAGLFGTLKPHFKIIQNIADIQKKWLVFHFLSIFLMSDMSLFLGIKSSPFRTIVRELFIICPQPPQVPEHQGMRVPIIPCCVSASRLLSCCHRGLPCRCSALVFHKSSYLFGGRGGWVEATDNNNHRYSPSKGYLASTGALTDCSLTWSRGRVLRLWQERGLTLETGKEFIHQQGWFLRTYLFPGCFVWCKYSWS